MSIEALIKSSFSSNEWTNRFPTDVTIPALKNRLELITGATQNMKIYKLDKHGNIILDMTDELLTLKDYCQPNEVLLLRVVDNSILKDNYEDLSDVKKFQLTDEEYTKRTDTVRNFLASKGITGSSGDHPPKIDDNIDNLKLGDRCKISMDGQPVKFGSIMFLGPTKFKEGNWVGVKCDLPLGKNDGSVEGVKYFECPLKYGVFVRPKFVEVGNYPEEDDFEL